MAGQVNLQGTYNYGGGWGQGYTGYGSGSQPPVMAQNGGFDPNALYQQFQSAHDQANQANDTRYADILAGYRDRHSRSMANLNALSDQNRKDIQQGAINTKGNLSQSRVSRGLSGTSIASTDEAGVDRDTTAALARNNDQLMREKIGLDTGLDQDTLQFMERRNDVGPDYGMLMQLAQGLGRGAGAGGGGGLSIGGGGGGRGGKEDEYARGAKLKEKQAFDPASGKWVNMSSEGIGPGFWDTPGGKNILADSKRTGKPLSKYFTDDGDGAWVPPPPGGGPTEAERNFARNEGRMSPEFPAPNFDFDAVMGAGGFGGGAGGGNNAPTSYREMMDYAGNLPTPWE